MEQPITAACKRTEVVIPDHQVRCVVVYPDRAEVTREVRLQLDAGENEVVLKCLSKALDKDSVRVDGVGAASITEVSFQEIAVTKEETTDQIDPNNEAAKLQEEIYGLGHRIKKLKQKKQRVEGHEVLLDDFCKSLIDSGESLGTGALVNKETIDSVFSFMDTFEERSVEMKTNLSDTDQELADTSSKINELQKRLKNLKPQATKNEPVKETVIGVMLVMKEKGEIVLKVSYVVSNASWKPKYDLRVSSAKRTMAVAYFGLVQQNTGENWVDAKLSLSTASPSIGGVPPELDTCRLTLHHNDQLRERASAPQTNSMYFGSGLVRSARSEAMPPTSAAFVIPQAKVTEGLSSSVFEVETPATIPSDSSSHKVSITTIDLNPKFEYETVPKLSQHAFLKAIVKNDSRYPLLAGPANAFLDQSFVTTTSIPNVSPNEEFSCSLGADASVRVVYKPVERHREQTGLISKTVVYTYKQVTEIVNNRSETAVVTYTDQIPKSSDEKLKVTLLEPALVKPKPGAGPPNPHLNSQSHVVWAMEIKPGESNKVTVKYRVEYPHNKKIEGL